MNTATADQLEAAVRHAHSTVDRVRGLTGGKPIQDDALADALLRRLIPNGVPNRVCVHANMGPRVLFVSAADPGVARCADCHGHPLEVLRRERHAETWDCDSCREEADYFHEMTMVIGPYILSGHVCRSCHDRSRP